MKLPTHHCFKDITGKRFGRLLVVKIHSKSRHGNYLWLCRCDCGKSATPITGSLISGASKSCGCLKSEVTGNLWRKHGGTKLGKRTPEYSSWGCMRQRCTNPRNQNYHRYGGRGILVCKRWMEDFNNFLLDMGNKPSPEYELERINNNGNYDPSNCRWATRIEQANNTRQNVLLTLDGKTQNATQWASQLGIRAKLIHARKQAGWNDSNALLHPYRKHR